MKLDVIIRPSGIGTRFGVGWWYTLEISTRTFILRKRKVTLQGAKFFSWWRWLTRHWDLSRLSVPSCRSGVETSSAFFPLLHAETTVDPLHVVEGVVAACRSRGVTAECPTATRPPRCWVAVILFLLHPFLTSFPFLLFRPVLSTISVFFSRPYSPSPFAPFLWLLIVFVHLFVFFSFLFLCSILPPLFFIISVICFISCLSSFRSSTLTTTSH
jgi:hypothetical protein